MLTAKNLQTGTVGLAYPADGTGFLNNDGHGNLTWNAALTTLGGFAMTGYFTLAGDPVSALQPVTKQYADTISTAAATAQTTANAAATPTTVAAAVLTETTRAEAAETALALVQPGYLYGLVISNDATTPNSKIDVSAGTAAAREIGSGLMQSTGVLTIDCTSRGANGLDTGILSPNTWYHAYLIGTGPGGAVAAFASTSLTPTLPSTYTQARRIGSFKTDGSGHIIAFSQNGDEFLWANPIMDANITLGTTATPLTLSTPAGVKTNAIVGFYCENAGSPVGVYFRSGDFTSGSGLELLWAPTGSWDAGGGDIRTNTSSQIYAYASVAGTTVAVTTRGYIDTRGRLA
jgi:hypothetical protein